MAENIKDRLIRYIQDAHAAETAQAASLRSMADNAAEPEVAQVFLQHADETDQQARMLEQRLDALGGDTSGTKSAMDSLMAKFSEFLNVFHDPRDRTTQDLIKACGIENFEIAMYTSMRAFANAIGDNETVRLAERIIAQEKAAAQKCLDLVPMLAARSAVPDEKSNVRA